MRWLTRAVAAFWLWCGLRRRSDASLPAGVGPTGNTGIPPRVDGSRLYRRTCAAPESAEAWARRVIRDATAERPVSCIRHDIVRAVDRDAFVCANCRAEMSREDSLRERDVS